MKNSDHTCSYYCDKPECIRAQRDEFRDLFMSRLNGQFETLQNNVIQWAIERGIIEHSNARAQLLKAMSEMGELADAEAKNDLDEIQDAVGDIIVCLISYSHFYGLSIPKCLNSAWNEIKDRKGHMIAGGVFVKDEPK